MSLLSHHTLVRRRHLRTRRSVYHGMTMNAVIVNEQPVVLSEPTVVPMQSARSLRQTVMLGSLSFNINAACSDVKQSKSGWPQSVTVVMIVDCCGRRFVSSWNCQHLSFCIHEPQEWCASRRIQLNATKTELIWFGSWVSLRQLKPEDHVTEAGHTVVQLTDVVHDLGILLDSELTIKKHVTRTVSSLVSTIFEDYGSSDVMMTRKSCSNWYVLLVALTTATRFYMDCLSQPSALYNECRMQLHGSHLVSLQVIMSVWYCSTDTSQVQRPSLFCCRPDGLEQFPRVRQIDEDSCQF